MEIKNSSQNNIHLATYRDGKIGFIQAAERLKGEALLSGLVPIYMGLYR